MPPPDVSDHEPAPHEGRALYVILSTVRRTDDNELIAEFADAERTVVCDISGGVYDTREEARVKAKKWLHDNYPAEKGYDRHRVRVYSIHDHLIRTAFAALPRESR